MSVGRGATVACAKVVMAMVMDGPVGPSGDGVEDGAGGWVKST